MREIKYKAYSKEHNTIFGVRNLFFYHDNGESGLNAIELLDEDENTQLVQASEVELLQYTGLKDKNGVEIFEGDIVGVYDCHNEEYDEGESEDDYLISKHTIKYCIDDHYPAFDMSPVWDEELNSLSSVYHSDDYYMKVLGNQFDNPELLEV